MRAKQIAVVVTLALAAPLLQPKHARAATYDAFKQYSIKVNPSGAWSYRAAGHLLPLKHTKCNTLKKDYCWTNNNDGYPTEAADEANKSGKTVSYLDVILPASYLDFDPEQTADVEFVWTAPTAGAAKITGNFLGVATNEGAHNVAVLHNGAALGTYAMTAYKQKQIFSFKANVAAGDTITFISYTGNNGGALSTGIQAKITLK